MIYYRRGNKLEWEPLESVKQGRSKKQVSNNMINESPLSISMKGIEEDKDGLE